MFSRRSGPALPRVAPSYRAPVSSPTMGGVEEALWRLSGEGHFDLDVFMQDARSSFFRLRRGLWSADVGLVEGVVSPSSRLLRQVRALRERGRCTVVKGWDILEEDLVRAPDDARALTVRYHYRTNGEAYLDLVSGVVSDSLPSHHKEDVTFVHERDRWLVRDLSVIS